MEIAHWQKFGLQDNPYNTDPLSEGGHLSIPEAFVGRGQETKYLAKIIDSANHGCITVCGDAGVGKTSFVNFLKREFKYDRTKLLFSSRQEIEANKASLTKDDFILEIIATVLGEIRLLHPHLLKRDPLPKLQSVVDISLTIDRSGQLGASSPTGLGLSIGAGKSTNIHHPTKLPTATLEMYLTDLIQFVKTHEIGVEIPRKYSGLIVHVNNFDNVLRDKEYNESVVQFFSDIRDLLQFEDIYFVFLGPPDFYRNVIGAEKKVKSIFHAPMMLKPLGKNDVVKALDKRMEILQSEYVQHYIKPINDEAVHLLYDIFEGDIRSILKSLTEIVLEYPGQHPKTLSSNEAVVVLGDALWGYIDNSVRLTATEKEVLLKIIQRGGEPISQTELSRRLNKQQPNVSKYFKKLADAGIIELKDQKGTSKLWGLAQTYLPLLKYDSAKKGWDQDLEIRSRQTKLF